MRLSSNAERQKPYAAEAFDQGELQMSESLEATFYPTEGETTDGVPEKSPIVKTARSQVRTRTRASAELSETPRTSSTIAMFPSNFRLRTEEIVLVGQTAQTWNSAEFGRVLHELLRRKSSHC